MSDYENWTGTLEELKIPEEVKSWEQQVKYLQQAGYKFEDLDFEEKYFYVENSDCVYINHKWYCVKKQSRDTSEDIFEAKQDGKLIRFELRYYNGGCGFSEAIHIAMGKLLASKPNREHGTKVVIDPSIFEDEE